MVDETSAAPILDNTERSGIPANHSQMCKFEDKNSAGYKTMVAALMRYTRQAPPTIRFRWEKAKEMFRVQRMNEASELIGV